MTNNRTRYIIILVKNKANILEVEQNMKTLALQKIRERADFLLRRIKHRAIQYNKGEISFEEFLDYKKDYEAQFIGYVRAFWDIEVLTYEERDRIINKFSLDILELKKEI